MNLKKWLVVALVASQAAIALPVSADNAQQGTGDQSSVQQVPQNSTDQSMTGDSASNGAVNSLPANNDGSAANPQTSTPNESSSGSSEPSNQPATPDYSAMSAGPGQLVLMMNSNKMYQDGKLYLAGQPMTVKNGVSYIAIRAIVERVGLVLAYDSKTKETIITSGSNELRFKTNSNVYKVNGVSKPMKGASYQQKNTFMVPLTSITQALNIPYAVDQKAKKVILSLSTKPVATFTIQPVDIYAGQTQVMYQTSSSSPRGLAIVEERWEGREDIFQEPGPHVVTYSVRDSSGQWSDPFSITIDVKKPNEPPVAMFTTDKDTYKMGELVTITDQSTDDENAIISRDWLNNRLAFFTPGPVTIKLTVTDKHGASSYYEKTINITNETLYTEDDFNKIFTPIGAKYTFNGSSVPSMNKIQYTFDSEPRVLIRSNSPETVYSEGIVYKETAVGSTRFMIHHKNSTNKDMMMYVVATNRNSEAASLITDDIGFAGPSEFATAAGKLSVQRYFESMQTGSRHQEISLQPGESKVILNDLSAQKIKPEQVISLLADTYSDYPIEYNIIMIDPSKDPLKTLPYLYVLERDGIHNRGTYPMSTRNIEVSDLVGGSTPSRLALGDNGSDPNLTGMDGVTGLEASNAGNFGVLYDMKFDRVAPNTLITFNPRGGKFAGFILVNGNIVDVASNGAVDAPNETSVLYRTGSYETSVEILFTAAPGSNLPINFLFMPLPERKN
ncbi:copper amine oxidase N-terminal domain-containing protein [Paenibacillus sediminis]|uniref:Copper amine oxidase-like N-terminal domain-containing protein n=1 Tax=Paenibacillus sediminis TaxID=664909 RepID=A0ABS4GZD4_9BACL|nr:copper amine oxidase N-terminal domain-containing protein [Paenibacillus sediminis]MBP1935624.1 hypothetical protein [Paenibacillus sediminis]